MTEKEMLLTILQNTEETKADVRELKERVQVLEGDMKEVKEDIHYMKGDMCALLGNSQILKKDSLMLHAEFKGIKSKDEAGQYLRLLADEYMNLSNKLNAAAKSRKESA